jgi:cytochrome c55X
MVAAVALTASSAASEPTAERRAQLEVMFLHDCGSCHGLTMNGGLGPSIRPSDVADLSDHDLATIITDGIPGTPMPPWGRHLSSEDVGWIIRLMRQGTADAR